MMSRRVSMMLASASALSLCIVAPASARGGGTHGAEDEVGAVADRLSDPATQIAVTAALAAMTEALLDFRVGPFAKAVDEAGGGGHLRDVPADARVRDLAGPDADRLSGDIARKTPRMMNAMAGMADSLSAMMPQLRAMAERMRRSLPSGALPQE